MASQLSITRAAIWKHIQALVSMGLPVETMKGKGYRLLRPLDLLSKKKIVGLLPSVVAGQISILDVLLSCDSSNDYIAAKGPVHGSVCFTEHQVRGRGRRGRQWVSPMAQNIYCSIGWLVQDGVQSLSGLSLAVGAGLARWLDGEGVKGVGVKWPNDIVVNDQKLAGILIEVSGDLQGLCGLTLGIGLNVAMERADIDQPWVSLRSLGVNRARNELAAAMLKAVMPVLQNYPERGFQQYMNEWARYDACCSRQVRVQTASGSTDGVALGVNQEGALLVESEGRLRVINGGEVSLRLTS